MFQLNAHFVSWPTWTATQVPSSHHPFAPISSLEMAEETLLERAEALIRERGLLIIAIVCTIVVAAAYVAPKVYAMCAELARAGAL